MGVRARVSRCSLQRRPRRDGEEAHLGLGELRAPQVGSNWLYELSAPISFQNANWIPRAGAGSKARVTLSAPLERLLEPGELRLREKDHANVTVTSTWGALFVAVTRFGVDEYFVYFTHILTNVVECKRRENEE